MRILAVPVKMSIIESLPTNFALILKIFKAFYLRDLIFVNIEKSKQKCFCPLICSDIKKIVLYC